MGPAVGHSPGSFPWALIRDKVKPQAAITFPDTGLSSLMKCLQFSPTRMSNDPPRFRGNLLSSGLKATPGGSRPSCTSWADLSRSEERRVGKESRSQWVAYE